MGVGVGARVRVGRSGDPLDARSFRGPLPHRRDQRWRHDQHRHPITGRGNLRRSRLPRGRALARRAGGNRITKKSAG